MRDPAHHHGRQRLFNNFNNIHNVKVRAVECLCIVWAAETAVCVCVLLCDLNS